MGRGTRVGIGLLAATLAYWTVFLGVGIIVFGRLPEGEIMHIGSPERRFYFAWIGWLLAASYLAMVFGYRWGNRLWLQGTSRRQWPTPIFSFLGYLGFVGTLAYQFVILLVLGSPGWVI